jgi:hypothetical protein
VVQYSLLDIVCRGRNKTFSHSGYHEEPESQLLLRSSLKRIGHDKKGKGLVRKDRKKRRRGQEKRREERRNRTVELGTGLLPGVSVKRRGRGGRKASVSLFRHHVARVYKHRSTLH